MKQNSFFINSLILTVFLTFIVGANTLTAGNDSEKELNVSVVFTVIVPANTPAGDTVFVVGTTARTRTAHRNYARPREIAPAVVERAKDGVVALLFGREDRGLENDALDLCHSVAIIPTNLDFSSLLMAQDLF